MDSEVYAVGRQQLYGAEGQPVDLTTPDLEARAARVLANAAAVGVDPFIKPRDGAAGNAKLHLAVGAQLFNDRPGLEVVADEAVARELAGLDLDAAGDTREARTFKLWMNSLEAWAGPAATAAVQIRALFAACRAGVPLLAPLAAVRPRGRRLRRGRRSDVGGGGQPPPAPPTRAGMRRSRERPCRAAGQLPRDLLPADAAGAACAAWLVFAVMRRGCACLRFACCRCVRSDALICLIVA